MSDAIRDAFAEWANTIPVNFINTNYYLNPDITIMFAYSPCKDHFFKITFKMFKVEYTHSRFPAIRQYLIQNTIGLIIITTPNGIF